MELLSPQLNHRNRSIESKDQDKNGDVQLIQLADIGDGEFRYRSSRFLTSEKATELKCTFLEKDDVLIARMPEPLGRACLFPFPEKLKYVTVVDVCVVRTGSKDISNKYLLYAINSPEARNKISDYQSGSTRKRISRSNLSTIPIPIAPKAEQLRIVAKIEELFSELDKGIENLKMAQAQLKVYRQALLKYAFEGQLTAKWRERQKGKLEPGEHLLKQLHTERADRFQAAWKSWEEGGKIGRKPVTPKTANELSNDDLTGLPLIPKEWIWVNLQTVLETKPSNGRSVKDRKGGFPVLRLTALRGETLILTENKEGDWTVEEAEPYLVREGDFFISRGNGSKHLVGLGCLAKDVTFPAAYPDTMIRLRPEKSFIEPSFLALIWNSRLIRNQIEGCARTTAGIYKINQEQIQNFRIPLLTRTEQLEIVSLLESRLSVVAAVEKTINEGLAKAEVLRQAILKKAFSGQLVPQDPDDEPAPVLQERIKAEKSALAQLPKRKAKEKVKV